MKITKYITITTIDSWTNHRGFELVISNWFYFGCGFKGKMYLQIFRKRIL